MTKETLSSKRKELIEDIRTRENPLLSFGLYIMEIVEKQDREFIKKLKNELFCYKHTLELIDNLAGEELIHDNSPQTRAPNKGRIGKLQPEDKPLKTTDVVNETLNKKDICECGHDESWHIFVDLPACDYDNCSCKKFKPLKKSKLFPSKKIKGMLTDGQGGYYPNDKPLEKGLKVIDGTPTAISKFLREKKGCEDFKPLKKDICECGHVKSSHGYFGYSDGSNDLGKGECRTCEGNDDVINKCKKFKPLEGCGKWYCNDKGKPCLCGRYGLCPACSGDEDESI